MSSPRRTARILRFRRKKPTTTQDGSETSTKDTGPDTTTALLLSRQPLAGWLRENLSRAYETRKPQKTPKPTSRTLSKRADYIAGIVRLTASLFGVRVQDLLGRSRLALMVDPRMYIAQALLREGLTGTERGQILRRDRTSVINLDHRWHHFSSVQPWMESVLDEIMDLAAQDAGYDRKK